jgi:hypothetical protein
MQQLCQWGCGSFLFNHLGTFLVSSQLAQHSCSHSLDIFYLIKQQLKPKTWK